MILNDIMNSYAMFLKTLGQPTSERKLAALLFRTEKFSNRILTAAVHQPFNKDDLHRLKDPYE